MSQDQLQQARNLIQQKRYSEARQILYRVNSPTAARWLAKLDEIAPTVSTPLYAPPKQTRRRYPLAIFTGVLGLALGFMLGFLVFRGLPTGIIPGPSEEFIGNWINNGGVEAIFRPDGLGQISGSQLEWHVLQHEGDQYVLQLTFTRPGDMMYGLSNTWYLTILSENTMQLTIGPNGSPINYQLVTRRTD